MRFKNRYLLCELQWENGKLLESVSSYTILNAIKESIEVNFGDLGLGRCLQSLQVKYYNYLTGLCILRVSRDHFHLMMASLTFLSQIQQRPVNFHTLRVTGTIRSCQKFAIDYNRRQLMAIISHEEQKAQLQSQQSRNVFPAPLSAAMEKVGPKRVKRSATNELESKSMDLGVAVAASDTKRKAEELLSRSESDIKRLEY
jgi:ribonuclease P/MRP protein subunit POP5